MDYNRPASLETVEKVTAALKGKGYDVVVVKTGKEALEKIKEMIPEKATLMNGSSVTLEQIGFIDYLKSGRHKWENLHAAIVAEEDKPTQTNLRKQALFSNYYLGSVHALTETGELVVASNTGSQLSHIIYTSPHLILVISTKKIVSNLDTALKRLYEHVVPLEDKHMQEKFGVGTAVNKIIILNGENPMMGRKIHIILIEEDLGF